MTVGPSETADNNNNDHLVQSDDPQHPANLIPDLCRRFYNWGWVTGTGGGVSSPSDFLSCPIEEEYPANLVCLEFIDLHPPR